MNNIVTLENIIKFQDALIKVLEVSKEGDLKAKLFIDSYKSQIESLKDELGSQNHGVTRVEIISKKEGREKVVRAEDIELSYQDDGRTLKIFYGYVDNDKKNI
jgi:hypothetical protein